MKRVWSLLTRETGRWTRGRINQTFTTFLCIVLIGPAQTLVSAQEPASAAQQKTPVAPAASPNTTQASNPVGQQELPAAPEPQLSMLVQQAQPSQQPQPDPQAQPAQDPQSSTSQQPVGTAAAPYEKPVGVSGSRPAGAAIAPAKQKRVRAIVIKVGLIAAGAAAIGTVVGLSMASHSTP